ncbi:MAG: diacylglycerol kinase family lipid kinase [Cytophagales bacterium]|nr:diacylglycerol kinase family lipid kinase [Armatimonadota bacterium]
MRQTTEQLVNEGGVVIFNPVAGRGQGGVLRAEAQEKLGPGFDWWPSQHPGHARELARTAAEKYSVVVAFGGDGTVGDVARGIRGSDATLGVLPVGTGNDFARNLGLKLDLNEAIATIQSGVIRRIDVGTVNGTSFINNAGTGFDACVMMTMNTGIRFLRGQPAFIAATLKTLASFKPLSLTYQADDNEPVTEKAMMLSILNGRMYGGGMLAAPQAEMDDGQIDVLIIRAVPKPNLLALMPKVINGQHENHPAVQVFKARRLTVTTIPPQPLNIDGDVSGLTPMEIGVESRSLKVLVR